jgi:adenine-specific DNA-methyltransferase
VARPTTAWRETKHDAGAHGTGILNQLVPGQEFSYPKSIYTVEDTLRLFIGDKPEALVLDYFAGSGTTAHAVFRINQQDGGRRRCILVTNNEVDDKTARRLHKQGLYVGDPEFDGHGIFEAVTRPRVAAAITGTTSEGKFAGGEYLDGRPLSEGFEENCAFFRLDYLEPDDVELGRQFAVIVPILWLASGGIGPQPDPSPTQGYLLPAASPFAVLLRESAFRRFATALDKRPDVTHTWLVTDSERAFADLRSALPGDRKVGMLYRDYLRNFAINTVRTA